MHGAGAALSSQYFDQYWQIGQANKVLEKKVLLNIHHLQWGDTFTKFLCPKHLHQAAGLSLGIVLHSKVDVERAHEVRVGMNDLCYALASEGFLAEAALDIVQHLGMCGVVLIQYVAQCEVCRAEAVAEVLSKDPTGV